MSNDSIDDWNITCIAGHPHGPLVYALVVMNNGEDFYSYIYKYPDFDSPDIEGETLYEVSAYLTDLWVSSSGYIAAVDAEGNLHVNQSGAWEIVDIKCPNGLNWIWGLADDVVFACGDAGAIVRLRNNRWEHFDKGVDGDLYGLHGTAADDLYAVGEDGRIFHYDGVRWIAAPSPTNHILNSVWCESPKKVFIAGEGGMLFEGDGANWTRLGQLDVNFYALASYQDQLYVGAGGDGVALFAGGSLDIIKDNIIAYGLGASDKFLCAAGDSDITRFDGTSWMIRSFS